MRQYLRARFAGRPFLAGGGLWPDQRLFMHFLYAPERFL
jgi:hypothetical protein